MAPWPRAPVIPQLVDCKKFRDNRWVRHLSLTSCFKLFAQIWIKKEDPCLGVTPINTKNHDGSNFHLRSLAKRNEIDPFLKHMVTGDEKWVTYFNNVRKRSWPKCGEAAPNGEAGQTRINGQEGNTVYLAGLERNNLLRVASTWPNTKFKYLLLTSGPFEASD
ncbi:hypothetical protein TNCV_1841201 [Trichonephila clavipes]|nr:hypothetical protein TNCV_1841201 [Trichonephila clavipes]